MKAKGNLKSLDGVAWGGGEPTRDKSFKDIMETIVDYLDGESIIKYLQFVRYNETVKNILMMEKFQ